MHGSKLKVELWQKVLRQKVELRQRPAGSSTRQLNLRTIRLDGLQHALGLRQRAAICPCSTIGMGSGRRWSAIVLVL